MMKVCLVETDDLALLYDVVTNNVSLMAIERSDVEMCYGDVVTCDKSNQSNEYVIC